MKIAWDFDSVESFCSKLREYSNSIVSDTESYNKNLSSALSSSSGNALNTLNTYDAVVEANIVMLAQSYSDFAEYLSMCSKKVSEAEDSLSSIVI